LERTIATRSSGPFPTIPVEDVDQLMSILQDFFNRKRHDNPDMKRSLARSDWH